MEIDVPEPLIENSRRTVREIEFFDDNRGIMVCSNSYIGGNHQTTIFYTEDGGLNWLPAYDSYDVPYSVTLGNNGYAWVNITSDNIEITKDYGKTWETVVGDIVGAYTSNFYFVNDANLFSLSRTSDTYFLGKSSNLGNSWTHDTCPTITQIR